MASWCTHLILLALIALSIPETSVAFGGRRRGGGRVFRNPGFQNAAQNVQNYQDKQVAEAKKKAEQSQQAAKTAKAAADAKGAKDPGKGEAKAAAEAAEKKEKEDTKDFEDKLKTLEKMQQALDRMEALDPGRGDTSQEIEPSKESAFSADERMPATESQTGKVAEAPDMPAAEGVPSDSGATRAEGNTPSSPDVQSSEQLARQMSDKQSVGNTAATDATEGGPSAPNEPQAANTSGRETPPSSDGATSQPDSGKADEISKPSEMKPESPEVARAESPKSEPSKEAHGNPARGDGKTDPAAAKAAEKDGWKKSLENLGKGIGDFFGKPEEKPSTPSEQANKAQPSAAETWKNMKENLGSLAESATKTMDKVTDAVGKAFEPITDSTVGAAMKDVGQAVADSIPASMKDPEMAAHSALARHVDKMVGEPGIYKDIGATLRESPESAALFRAGAKDLKELAGMEAGLAVSKMSTEDLAGKTSNPVLDKYRADARAELGPQATTQQVEKLSDANLFRDLKAAEKVADAGRFSKMDPKTGQFVPNPSSDAKIEARAKYQYDGIKSFEPREQSIFGDSNSHRQNLRDQASLMVRESMDLSKYGTGAYGDAPRAKPAASQSTGSAIASKPAAVPKTTTAPQPRAVPAAAKAPVTRAPASTQAPAQTYYRQPVYQTQPQMNYNYGRQRVFGGRR